MEEKQVKVKSLQKAIQLLSCFTIEEPKLGVSELAKRTGLLKSTVHNMLSTLETCAMIERTSDGKYTLGVRCLCLGSVYRMTRDSNKLIRTALNELSEITGETVNLAVCRGQDVIYLENICPKASHITLDYSGETAPLYCTGVGKSILAHLPKMQQEEVLKSKLIPFTQNTITNPEELSSELALIRERGYAVDRAEHEYDIACVAMAILNEFGVPVASVSVSGLEAHFTEEKIKEFCKYLAKTAELVRMYL